MDPDTRLDGLNPVEREAVLWIVREQLADVRAEVWRRRFGETLIVAIMTEYRLNEQLERYGVSG